MELLVDFAAFWHSLSADLKRARRSAYVQTFSFEGDATGRALADALISANLPDIRILADSFTKYVLSDQFLYAPRNWFRRSLRDEKQATRAMLSDLANAGVPVRFTNPLGLGARRCLARNHKKLVVLDDSIAYLGGINFSDHNAAWHDLMLRIEHPGVAQFFRDDFLSTWDGANRLASAVFPGLECHTLDGRDNPAQFARLLDLINSAEQEIYVASPYITFPFYEALRGACARGAWVQVVTPAANNWRIFTDYARREAAQTGLDLRFYSNGMSHLKAMLIDNRGLVLGSSNFDYLSYRIHQEILAVVNAPDVIAQFRAQVMQPDLATSQPAGALTVNGRWLDWRINWLTKGLQWVCR